MIEREIIEGEDQVRARQKSRATVTAFGLGAFALLMFAISIVKMMAGS